MSSLNRHRLEYEFVADIRDIPFTSSSIGPDEIEAVVRAMRSGQVSAGGPLCERAEQRLAESTGASFALLTPSLSRALDLSFAALGVRTGDTILLSSLSSPRIANAILARGARPVFCDVEVVTRNLDPSDVEQRLSSNSRFVVASHEDGVASDLAVLAALAHDRGAELLEDASTGIGAACMGRHLGSVGKLGWISFEDGMNVSAGSGAAFLTSDSALFMRALALRSPERSLCVPDDIDNVSTWSGEGGGFAPSDMLAALLEGQLLRLQELTRVRRRTWECYDEGLADLDLEAGGPLRRPHTPRRAADNAHAYTLQARTRALRDKLRKELSASGIETRVLAEPLHLSTYARRVLGPQPRLLRSEVVAECALQLPLSAGISKQQAERVVDVVRRVARPQRRRPHTLAPRSGKQTAHKGSIVPAS